MQGATHGDLPLSRITGRIRVLCLGDSNTYGVYLDRERAYPAQLEGLWNETVGAPALEVINLGYPGTNSSRLVRDLSDLLQALEPDVLVLMIGVNDFWIVPFSISDQPEIRRPSFLERHSKIHRLLYLLYRGRQARQIDAARRSERDLPGAERELRFADREYDVSYRREPGRGPPQAELLRDQKALERNLSALLALANASGTPTVLMSYPGRPGFYSVANATIRRVAAGSEALFIDLTDVFLPLCPEIECPDHLFADNHPSAAGYRVVAETLVARLAELDGLRASR